MNNNIYKACRRCRYYVDKCCTLDMFMPTFLSEDDIYSIAEEGSLSEVIEETLNSSKPEKILKELDNLLAGWKISKTRRKEVLQLFDEMFPEYNDFTLKEQLDENISRLYQERLVKAIITDEIEIKEPDNFYCSRWE